MIPLLQSLPLPQLFADAGLLTTHQFARLQAMTEWWHWLLLALAVVGVSIYVVRVYRLDSQELSSGLAVLLLFLRIAAFLGILFYFFDLERRSERRVVKNSRAILLVDTSQSMGIVDADALIPGANRLEQLVREFSTGRWLDDLRQLHDVVVYRFDQGPRPLEIGLLRKLGPSRLDAQPETPPAKQLLQARIVALLAGVMFLGGVVFLLVVLFGRSGATASDRRSWGLVVAFVLTMFGAVLLAVASLRTPEFDLRVTIGVRGLTETATRPTDGTAAPQPEKSISWEGELLPRGVETRIGDAIDYVVSRERGGPIAGIVLLSDGGQNAGQNQSMAVIAARDAGIPIHTVGLGSDRRPTNIRVVDLEVPGRIYPGDRFALTGMVQSFGYSGRAARVELFMLEGSGDNWPRESIEERRIRLGADGEVQPVRFELPSAEVGTRSFKIRVSMAERDAEEKDNERTATVQVVDRKTKVLLFAGGPSRDFQFLRNMLHRDRDTTVDVLLQTGQPGISQDANDILFEFPGTAEELFQYDCLVAFDPDWETLSTEQARLLERWVAEEAGGLIALAGPVHTPHWSSKRAGDPVGDIVKALYPVSFYYQGAATLSLGRFGGDKAFPLQFTSEGLNADFLWLTDDAATSEATWKSFEGVYGFYAVKDPKPGAKIYALFSDPDTEIDKQLPIYLAGQFYGAGRVFFQASGEMWRVRSVDDTYFDTFYTKLIRWTSQGRLLRDSKRGMLLLDKDRCLVGEHVVVRAILRDAQRRPLIRDQVPVVLVTPQGQRLNLELKPIKDSSQDGVYGGQFTPVQDGDYYVELLPPDAAADELLRKEVRVRVPALEVEKAERNDALLTEIAEQTRGRHYTGLPSAMEKGTGSLIDRLTPQDQVTFLPGTPDKNFERVLMSWLMGVICGVLCLEWLIRRLSKLA